MRETMDVNTFSLQASAHQSGSKCFPELSPPNLFVTRVRGAGRFDAAPFLEVLPGETLPELRERLRNEINHGREYLLRVQNELRENRRLLEQWAQYEQTCSLQPLDHLVQSVWLKQSVEKFLTGWLQRRQQELAKLERKHELPGKNGKTRRRRRAAVK